jgi:hypothetical protein
MLKTNSSMLIVWNGYRTQMILLTLQRRPRAIAACVQVVGHSVVRLRRRGESGWNAA